MLEHRLARDRKLGGELGRGRRRVLGKRGEQRPPGGIGQRAEDRAGAVVLGGGGSVLLAIEPSSGGDERRTVRAAARAGERDPDEVKQLKRAGLDDAQAHLVLVFVERQLDPGRGLTVLGPPEREPGGRRRPPRPSRS